MERYIIVYDIADDKRRLDVFKLIKNYAMPVPYSVFEAELTAESLVKLRYGLERIINAREDSIIFYRQCKKCQQYALRLGKSTDPFAKGHFVIGTIN